MVGCEEEQHSTEKSDTKCRKASENVSAGQSETKRPFRNLIIASTCNFLTKSGFLGLLNLQSTMNSEDGMGIMSQAIISIFATLVALTMTDVSIAKFGSKSLQILGAAACSLYLCSNLYLWSYTLFAASVIYGLANGVYSPALVYYVNEMATRYQTSHPAESLEVVMARFFGILGISTGAAMGVGNIISFAVLTSASNSQTSLNQTCGVGFDQSKTASNPNLDPPSETARLVLVGTYVVIGVASVVILLTLLDPLLNDRKENAGCHEVTSRVMSAIKHLANPHQLLILPLTIFQSMVNIFFTNEYTQAFIACSWGIEKVGYVALFATLCYIVSSLLVGPLVKKTSLLAVIGMAVVANGATMVGLFVWQPSPDTRAILFVVGGVWGLCCAIFMSQTQAIYGLMFPDNREAAYANFYVWGEIGTLMSYLYSPYLSVATKIYILFGLMTVGVSGYFVSQRQLERNRGNKVGITCQQKKATEAYNCPATWKATKEEEEITQCSE